ncbi:MULTISPECIES: MmcQ/YjbR family DNA-binding protein [Dietzia]|jgi:predicted DNA-binding protein (MmcQ/YjbR family)|uniref:MmcQ/YjbR family DNA-binding protein n=1 Tax=Dietzia maris TaxID=37915 RepID=A0A365PE14_9ACTN|nr:MULTISPECIES: MmcQ/YjbR family DNA-binding protein [Dietzia]MBB0991301.1 MmcQ/YjbR family DNA-binding protein [Dietzia sp. SLG510A3-30A2]MVZ91439.1 MmcQ/YjbR family DNA-binding protein [Microbacter sp. ANSKLAB05]MDJ0423013.1 MmcQ/YjbR family DNA-binding protein [Dietzia kunjamensis]MDN4506645.1 MmcQ/YjbR family DNA-binding protein [Dietzia maris]RBA40109.1 MmcQ/YjbR family DNA-binding protein [Dietzia maris]
MNGRELQKCAAMRARELPASTLEFPFGPDFDVFKVRGKMFMFHAVVNGERQVILKALPSDSMALRDAHADITPGYHMNKRHWISLHPGGTLTADMVSELVTESYRLVVSGLPLAQQPVEPHAFGRQQR